MDKATSPFTLQIRKGLVAIYIAHKYLLPETGKNLNNGFGNSNHTHLETMALLGVFKKATVKNAFAKIAYSFLLPRFTAKFLLLEMGIQKDSLPRPLKRLVASSTTEKLH